MIYEKKVLGVYLLLIASLIFITGTLFSAATVDNGKKIELVEEIKITNNESLEQGKELEIPWTLAVTEDDLVLIPDLGSGNIKIYEEKQCDGKKVLNLIKLLDQKGYGKDDLVKPGVCDFMEGKFAVLDYGTNKIIIYDRISRLGFKPLKEILCWNNAYDIRLDNNKIFIAGYITNSSGQSYDFYSIDIRDGNMRYLLPSYSKYGYEPGSKFIKEFKKRRISTIGIMSRFDICPDYDYAYIAWEGDLRIICLNTVSGEITKTFGDKEKSLYYLKPYASQRLIEARKNTDRASVQNAKEKMSYVKDIFVSSEQNKVFILYKGPLGRKRKTGFILQSYTLDGKFLKENILPDSSQPLHKFLFCDGKERILLYSLTGEYDKKSFSISKYEIKF